MNTKRYVQHISKQGRKWELDGNTREEYESATEWVVKSEDGSERHFLPKSEYVLCPPPERWVDVTAECTLDECGAIMHHGFNTFGDERYHRRKVLMHYGPDLGTTRSIIIIEQKVTD